MFKDVLHDEQPIVFQTLSHALCNQKVAHAYLFHGASGTPKKESAYLLAKSIVCSHVDENGFACEACDECRRIEGNNFSDMMVLDGTTTSIKKENILKLQHEFMKTGLEHTGKKIYVLNRAENATPDALNSLLKFLEEPGSDMIAILLVEQLDRLLPTIISRCQIVPFQPLTWEHCYNISKQKLDELDAYLISSMIRSPKVILEVQESEEYQHALYLFKDFQESFLSSPYDSLALLLQEGFDQKKTRNGKLCMQYFLEMLMTFYKDILQGGTWIENTWYVELISSFRRKGYDMAALLEIVLVCRDKLFKSVNITLLSDQLVYQMKEVIK